MSQVPEVNGKKYFREMASKLGLAYIPQSQMTSFWSSLSLLKTEIMLILSFVKFYTGAKEILLGSEIAASPTCTAVCTRGRM